MSKFTHDILNIEMAKGLVDVQTIENCNDSMLVVNGHNVHFYDDSLNLVHDYNILQKMSGVIEVKKGITASN